MDISEIIKFYEEISSIMLTEGPNHAYQRIRKLDPSMGMREAWKLIYKSEMFSAPRHGWYELRRREDRALEDSEAAREFYARKRPMSGRRRASGL